MNRSCQQFFSGPAFSAKQYRCIEFGQALYRFKDIFHGIALCHDVRKAVFLFNDRSLRIAPPLTITEEEIRKACAIILEGIDLVYKQQQNA